jgi:hypothetical protein
MEEVIQWLRSIGFKRVKGGKNLKILKRDDAEAYISQRRIHLTVCRRIDGDVVVVNLDMRPVEGLGGLLDLTYSINRTKQVMLPKNTPTYEFLKWVKRAVMLYYE